MNPPLAKHPGSRRWSASQAAFLAAASGVAAFLITTAVRSPHSVPTSGEAPAPVQTVTIGTADAKPDEKADTWRAEWEESVQLSNSPRRIRRLATLLETLARSDPQRALALARAETNWLARDELRDAALRGWGATAPDAAADWAMSHHLMGERMRCVSAVLTGAAEQPERAIAVALRVCAADPTPAGDYGHSLINALVERAGDFGSAARFATAATMVDRQPFLLDSAFYQWAQHEPERAMEELRTLSDKESREAAMKGVLSGWANQDAQRLAQFAQALPEGQERGSVLAVALPQWVGKDPEGALKWMNEVEPHPDFDRGVAALALQPTLLHQKPEVAMELTDTICDSAQRKLIKSNVFYQWAMRDRAAAERYAKTVQHPETREMLLDDLRSLAASAEH
jgi:hypothetical protein